jgi:hypothetical protein
MQDIRDEVDHPVWSKLGDRFELDSLGKLVDSHKDMSKPPWRRCKGPNQVKAPACKRPGRWYGNKVVSRDM